MSLSTPSMLALLYDVRGGTLPPWSPKAAGARASLRFSLCRWRQMRYMGREMTPKESSDIECIGSLGESGNCWDPYNQNVLKGDYPILGQNTFLVFTGIRNYAAARTRSNVGKAAWEPWRM